MLTRRLTRNGIQYFDAGGTVLAGPQAIQTNTAPVSGNVQVGGLLGAITPQSGYNANLAPVQQSDYSGLIQGAGANALAGNNQFNQNLTEQQQLAHILMQQANGGGPNPAQAMLSQNTGVNVANQGALMAGQRGAASNVGLMARQIAEQQAGIEQNAAGQAAALQAQQQLAAQQQAGNVLANVGSQITGQQNANTGLLGTGAGAQTGQNNTNVGNYSSVQGINAGVSENNAKNSGGLLGGILNSVGGLFGLGGKAAAAPIAAFKGGMIPSHLHAMASVYHPQVLEPALSGEVPGKALVKGDSPKNDNVMAMVSPQEIVLPRHVTMAADAPEAAKRFVEEIKKQNGDANGGNKEDAEEFNAALKRAMGSRRTRNVN